LTAVADRSGRFTQTCVQDQPNNDKDYKGSLDRVPEVIETELIDKPDTNQRPQSKNFQWFSTFSSPDKKLYINVNKQLKYFLVICQSAVYCYYKTCVEPLAYK